MFLGISLDKERIGDHPHVHQTAAPYEETAGQQFSENFAPGDKGISHLRQPWQNLLKDIKFVKLTF